MKVLNTRKNRVFGKRVPIPEFEIVSNPTIRITDIVIRPSYSYNVIDGHALAASMREIMRAGLLRDGGIVSGNTLDSEEA